MFSSTEKRVDDWTVDVDLRIYKGIQVGMDRGFIRPGNPIIIITGWKPGQGATNTFRVICAPDQLDPNTEMAPIMGVHSVPSLSSVEEEKPSLEVTEAPDEPAKTPESSDVKFE